MGELYKSLPVETVRAYAVTLAGNVLEWANPKLDQSTALTKDWPLVREEDAALLVVVYLALVAFGRMVMVCLPAIRLRTLKAFYNPLQILLCGWMCIEGARQAWKTGEPLVGMQFQPARTGIAEILWVFYITKILDFMDTAFIILEKDWRHLSFLHVYHHSTIFLQCWVNVRAGYDGDVYFTVVLNAFVHFVIYSYYMITSLKLYTPLKQPTNRDPVMAKPYSPWCTYLQLTQFLMMCAQAGMLLYYEREDGYPRNIVRQYLLYIISLFVLFSNFAMKNYCGGKKGSKKKTN